MLAGKGAVEYMAPEVLQSAFGVKYEGRPCDVWACGVMLCVPTRSKALKLLSRMASYVCWHGLTICAPIVLPVRSSNCSALFHSDTWLQRKEAARQFLKQRDRCSTDS